ncbi:hypothetical protein KY366_04825 [Candidatus Woesearchaeota archaeon]|nr:hypothetical protein [Candidatus Woesearchaeota archaeon]
MAEAIFQKQIVNELKAIRNDLDFIKDNMIDRDMILTPEEEKRFEESLKEHKEGKSTPLEDFEKEMKE